MIVREAIDFKRGITSKKAIDVGMDSSRFWPKDFKHLSKGEKIKALDNFGDWWNDVMAQDFPNYLVSNQYLLEPLHVLLQQTFGENPYENIEGEPMIAYDGDDLEFDMDRNTLNIGDAIRINDSDAFLKFLGISDDLIPEVHYTFGADTINFEENDSEYEFTESDQKQLDDAHIIFRKYTNDLMKQMKDEHNFYFSREMLLDHIKSNNVKFDSEYNPVF